MDDWSAAGGMPPLVESRALTFFAVAPREYKHNSSLHFLRYACNLYCPPFSTCYAFVACVCVCARVCVHACVCMHAGMYVCVTAGSKVVSGIQLIEVGCGLLPPLRRQIPRIFAAFSSFTWTEQMVNGTVCISSSRTH